MNIARAIISGAITWEIHLLLFCYDELHPGNQRFKFVSANINMPAINSYRHHWINVLL